MKRAICFLLSDLLPTAGFVLDESEPIRVVRAQVEAFNYHDTERVAALVAENIMWCNITVDAVSKEGAGRRTYKAGMVEYFKLVPTAHVEMDGISCVGEYVTFREATTWTSQDDGAHSNLDIAGRRRALEVVFGCLSGL